MIKSVIALIAFASISNTASAFYGPACGQSYRWDSFGRGIKDAFLDGNFRSRFNDEGCYNAGIHHGYKILKEENRSTFCMNSFLKGLDAGLRYDLNTNIADKCFTAGHTAGVSDLQVATREGDAELVGEACIKAYKKGKADFRVGTSSSWGAHFTNKIRHCYEQGLYEAPLMP